MRIFAKHICNANYENHFFSTHLLIHLLIQAPMSSPLRIAIIGGGAAGYFAAIEAKRNNANADITIFEKIKSYLLK